jgi:hypothetical protein
VLEFCFVAVEHCKLLQYASTLVLVRHLRLVRRIYHREERLFGRVNGIEWLVAENAGTSCRYYSVDAYGVER